MAEAHSAALGKCHPGLTYAQRAETSGAHGSARDQPDRDRATVTRSEAQGALEPRPLRPHACGAGLGAALLPVRALLHPLGLDAADTIRRRLSRRCEMALRLFA